MVGEVGLLGEAWKTWLGWWGWSAWFGPANRREYFKQALCGIFTSICKAAKIASAHSV